MIVLAAKQTFILLLLMIVGLISTKAGILNKEKCKGLADLLLYVVTPATILSNLQTDYSADLARKLFLACALFAAMQFISILLARILVRKKAAEEAALCRYAAAYGNCGYMGLPLVMGLMGSSPVMYVIVFIAIFNLFVFTHGISMLQNKKGKFSFRLLASPVIIMIVVALLLFFLNIRLPELVMKPVNMLGSLLTPLAMIIAGNSLADAKLSTLTEPSHLLTIGWVNLLKLVLIPLLIIPVVALLPLDPTLKMTASICISCPAATNTVIFAVKYDLNESLASELVSTGTILSILTIPLIVGYAGMFGMRV